MKTYSVRRVVDNELEFLGQDGLWHSTDKYVSQDQMEKMFSALGRGTGTIYYAQEVDPITGAWIDYSRIDKLVICQNDRLIELDVCEPSFGPGIEAIAIFFDDVGTMEFYQATLFGGQQNTPFFRNAKRFTIPTASARDVFLKNIADVQNGITMTTGLFYVNHQPDGVRVEGL